MGIDEAPFFVDYIRVIYNDTKESKIEEYAKDKISDLLLEKVKQSLDNNVISRIELKNIKNDLGMTIFHEAGLSHIGIVDMYNDLIYYFCKNVKEKTLVAISGYMFEMGMICQDNNILYEIITYFAKYGKQYPYVTWIEDKGL